MSSAYGATVGGGSTGTLGDEAGSGEAVPPAAASVWPSCPTPQPATSPPPTPTTAASSKTPRTLARTGPGYEEPLPARPTCLPDGPQVELAP